MFNKFFLFVNVKMKDLQISDFKITTDEKVHLKQKGPGILLVHAEWCGHCVRFMPDYRQIDLTLNKKKEIFPVVKIEESQLSSSKDGQKIMKLMNVRGFPTIYFFNESGKIIDQYSGDRNIPDILDKICKVHHKCVAYGS